MIEAIRFARRRRNETAAQREADAEDDIMWEEMSVAEDAPAMPVMLLLLLLLMFHDADAVF
ncbi:hypothetical protein MKW92_051156 [Papaver armeniacum]|nr:hypothetical protein MKW92_051156 [Papaver armeniacum]